MSRKYDGKTPDEGILLELKDSIVYGIEADGQYQERRSNFATLNATRNHDDTELDIQLLRDSNDDEQNESPKKLRFKVKDDSENESKHKKKKKKSK